MSYLVHTRSLAFPNSNYIVFIHICFNQSLIPTFIIKEPVFIVVIKVVSHLCSRPSDLWRMWPCGITGSHSPDEHELNLHRREKLKTSNFILFLFYSSSLHSFIINQDLTVIAVICDFFFGISYINKLYYETRNHSNTLTQWRALGLFNLFYVEDFICAFPWVVYVFLLFQNWKRFGWTVLRRLKGFK